jgi:hypothetical protein
MSKYLYLFRGGQTPNASPERMQAQMQKWMNWIEQLRRQERYVAGEPLESGGKVVSSEHKIVSDGPFAEGKEVVGGFFIVHAVTLEEAVEMSKACPIFETGGSVEVRPLRVVNP